jgi:signal transduction histidine kinase
MAARPSRFRDGRVERLERELEAACRISRTLSQHVNVDELVEQALRTALEVVEADAASVLLADPESKQLVFRHVIGVKAKQLRGMAIPWDQGIASVVFASGEAQVTSDARRDRRHLADVDASTGYRTRDMITLPLKQWEGKPIGVLQVLNKKTGRLGKADLSILTIISALTAAAIEQARLFEETKLAETVRLLGDIGHDVGNLLTPVICGLGLLNGGLEAFFDRLPATEAGKARETRELCDQVFGMLRDNARRIQDRVKEMADCVKGLSAPPQFAPCHVPSVAHHVLETLRFLATERGIALQSEGLDSLPAILADERRLYIAIYNLVNNAIPEVPAGGSVTIRGSYRPGTKTVEVSVIDTGRGMPPEVRDSLFTTRAISRKVGGTGLGTKIVKDVVEAHGGRITVESTEGRGSAFRIRLPLRPSRFGKAGKAGKGMVTDRPGS